MGNKPNWARGVGALGDVMLRYAFTKDRQDFTEKERVRREEAMAQLRNETNAASAARQQAAFAESERRAAVERERNLFAPEGSVIPNLTGGEDMPNPYAGMTRREVADDLRLRDMMNPQADEMGQYQAGMLSIAQDREARLIEAANTPASMGQYQAGMLGIAQDREARLLEAANTPASKTPYQEELIALRREEMAAGDKTLARQMEMYDTKQADKYFAEKLSQYNDDLFPLLGGKSGTKYYGGAYEKQPGGEYKRTTEVGGKGPDWLYKDKTDIKTLSGVLAEGLSEKLNDGIDEIEWKVFKEIAKSRGANLNDILSEWSTSHGEYVKKIDGKWYVNVDGEWMAKE